MTQFAKTLSIVIAGLVLAGAGAAQSSHAATNGLAAAYGFNEGTGSVLHDLSGNGNNGTITGASWVRGKYGGGLRFNGSSSRVTVPSSTSLSPTGAVTVEAWIRPQLAGSWRAVAIKEQNSAALSYGLYGATSTGASAYAYTGSEQNATGSRALPLNTWSHVAAVYDGTMLRLYLNGTLVAQQLVAGSIAETTGALRIGGDAIWGEWFSGTIDELRVYGRALTASEIQTDMTTRVAAIAGTTGADTQAPTAPTGFVSSSVTQTSAVLSWTASTDNVGVSGYGAYRNGTAAGSTSATTYTYSGLTCGTSYSLSVDAFDAAGNRSANTAVTVATSACSVTPDTQAPTAPTGLVSSSVSQTSVVLSWVASTDNVGVAGYGTYRNGIAVVSTGSTSSTFSGLTCGTSYSLGVDAFDGAGNRSARSSVSVSTLACADTSAPTAPTGLAASSLSQTGMVFGWNAATDNVGVAGYTAYLNGTAAGNTAALSYTLSGLACGTSYTIGVDATDAAGNRSARTSVSVATSACSGGGGASANVWLDTNGGSCARSAAAVAYVDASACGSFNAAWQVAQPGDTVRVKAGSYGGQFFSSHSPAMVSPGVSFLADSGTVSVGQIDIGDDPGNFGSGRGLQRVDWLSFTGPVSATSTTIIRHTTHVTLNGWTWNQGFGNRKSIFWAGNTDFTTISNSDICCTTDDKIMESTVPAPGFGANADITFSYTSIHSMRRSGSGVHNECFLAPATPGLTLIATHWYGCTVMNLNIGAFGDSTPYSQSNYHWVNNIFEAPTNLTENDKTGLPFFQGCNTPAPTQKPGWVVEYNLFATGWYSSCGGDNGLTLRGNIGDIGGSCPSGTSYSHNIWISRTCNPTDLLNASLFSAANFTNIAAHNYTYTPGAYQLGRGDPTNYPTTDLNRNPRPLGGTPDAGPYEGG